MLLKLDFSLLYLIQRCFKCGFLDFLMPVVTSLGNGGAFWIAACLIMLCRKKTRQTGAVMALAMLLCFLFGNLLLKNLIARPRPYAIDPSITLLIAPSAEIYSFPSGHTMNSFAAAFSLALQKERFFPAALALAALIAFSRLYLMMHFPLDIAGGTAFGFASALISRKIITSLAQKSGQTG